MISWSLREILRALMAAVLLIARVCLRFSHEGVDVVSDLSARNCLRVSQPATRSRNTKVSSFTFASFSYETVTFPELT